jgi:putative ABC transport system permease protein
MMIWRIVFKSLRQHLLSTLVTALSIALAGGLLMSVWSVKEQAQSTFTQLNGGFDAVLGARSSKLQLVLNAVFHMEASPANIAWSDYLELKSNANVELAVPMAMGDNYRGYRIVGTLPELFEKAEYAPGLHYLVQPPGRLFDVALREAVVGSFAAQKLNLKRGDFFHPYHGLTFDEKEQHAETYVVVGILEPSNTPADRVIWIPLEGVQKMGGHKAESMDELSAVLIKLRSPVAGRMLEQTYNKQGTRLTFAWPIGATMAELFNKISWFDKVLELVAYLVAAVATGSILASIYNSMNERRREIAILRALGAHRGTVFGTIVLEAATIAVLGMAIGFAFYLGIMLVVAGIVRAQTGVVVDPFAWNPVMVWAPLGMVLLSALAGIVPAFKAYRTDVAEHLLPTT